MKIVSYETFLVPRRSLIIKIETDTGLIGWGEATLARRNDTVRTLIDDFMKNYLIGKNPLEINKLYHLLYSVSFTRGGAVYMSALAGIDMALWDIKGKYYNAPVYELLGGKLRDKIRIYCGVGASTMGKKTPAQVAQEALEKKGQGLTAVKIEILDPIDYVDLPTKINNVVTLVKTVREAVGEDFGIAIDYHGRAHKAVARILQKKLEPFNLIFIEEPVVDEHIHGFIDLKNHGTTPIATGERMHNHYEFREFFEKNAVDIVNPDLAMAGGITGCHKIAVMAEAYDVAVAFHCPLGPITLAASLQLDACTHNAIIQEQRMIHDERALGLQYVKNIDEVFNYDNKGNIVICDKPGLGIEIDEEKVRELSLKEIPFQDNIWYLEDGRQAEW